MKNLDLNFICKTLNLPKPHSNQTINRVITDSRQAQSGDLFVTLIGENHDAHKFVPQVLETGAYCLVSQNELDLLRNFPENSSENIRLEKFGAIVGYAELDVWTNKNHRL